MGKKDKKKGKGIEKTALKTEKKLNAKQKKYLAKIGEDDIEKILAQIEEEEKKKVEIKEIKIEKPTRRANFSFIGHPLKEELFLFGGEFFNGQKTAVYNDLLNYNVNKSEWTVIQAPNAPPPRCGHQMVSVAKEKGQLWLFGGEFTSSTQNQFYHYKDLWVFHLGEKKWEKITCHDGPSARSGHRMVHSKNQLVVFGGYHDNLMDYRYFNDVHVFDMEQYKWFKIEPSGIAPSPRSGCQMVPLVDGKILISGGYSKQKIKKDVDKGVLHSDMFILTPEKNDTSGKKWKWVSVKQSGIVPNPRSGCSMAMAPGNRAFTFGGVFDTEENDEDINGTFYNDLNVLDLEKRSWRPVIVSKKQDSDIKKRRRKDKSEEDSKQSDVEDMEEVEVEDEPKVTTVTDGVFTMTIMPSSATSVNSNSEVKNVDPNVFTPSPRMNCGLTVKNGTLYLFGGLVEDDEKQLTLSDMYSLDLHRLDEWKILLCDEEAKRAWVASESENESDSDENEDEDEDEDGDEDCDNSDEDMDTE
ncbi:hypothetical protein RUM44_009889 [Polyplax serrata]|uniref:Kelch domain-containing protein 4 n=1 Tax=Polyplax serrata TaxID=468196 RepID=A0ABR1AU28_POLSC